MINFDENGNWQGIMKIPTRLRSGDGIKDFLGRLLKEIEDVKSSYLESRGNDGVLIGQEKANLIGELYEVVSGLLYFFHLLKKGNSEFTFLTIESIFYGYNIEIHAQEWKGSGYIKYHPNDISGGFGSFYAQFLVPKVQKLLLDFNKNLSDPSETSSKVFQTTLEETVYLIMVMIHALQTSRMKY